MNLGENSYDIIVERKVLANALQQLNLNRRVLVVTDTGVPVEYVKTLAAQYEYTSEVYVEYLGFNEVCKQSAEELQSICRGTVYLKDLRYLLCYQTDNFLKLCSAFSI